ncbi:MAG: PD-(D/E)XK nuclease-like domain-containing protein [Hyphomicrobiaceae bacterium]
MTARILDVSPDEYHALPAFSSTVAKELIARSPLHARCMVGKAPSKLLDRGSVIHRLVLGKGADYEVIQHGDWRTNAAKAARDSARSRGLVPVLAHEFEDYNIAAEHIRIQLAERDIVLDGRSEFAITWTEQTEFGPVECKGMLDHCWPDIGVILDLKITENASPSSVERTSENLGYAIQAAAYSRALVALDPDLQGRVAFAFAFCEPDEPYALNLSEPDGIFQEIGERRWLRAVREWAKCTAENKWPSYGTTTNPLTAPAWALAREGYTADER